jgi:predicted Zn-dependent protease
METGDLACAEKHYAMAEEVADLIAVAPGLAANRRFGRSLQKVQMLALRNSFDAARTELATNWDWVAASDNPNNKWAYNLSAGRIELAQKNYAKASEFFAKANPEDPAVWYYKAQAAEGSGDRPTARWLYQKVVNWDQLDTTGYSIVRPLALAKVKTN